MNTSALPHGSHNDYLRAKLGYQIAVSVGNSSYLLRLREGERLLIGRELPRHELGIDTTAIGGLRAGVSRRHCEIIFARGRFFIHDLRSRNGTYVSQQRLRPLHLYPLHSGDTILLGTLRVQIHRVDTNVLN